MAFQLSSTTVVHLSVGLLVRQTHWAPAGGPREVKANGRGTSSAHTSRLQYSGVSPLFEAPSNLSCHIHDVASPGGSAHRNLPSKTHKTQTSNIQLWLKLTKTHVQKQPFYKTVPFVLPFFIESRASSLFTGSSSAFDFSIFPQYHVLKPNLADHLF